jgi:molybdopterin synthase sulfur carrier subunit
VKVKLLYFAVVRDIVGLPEEEWLLADGSRPLDVWNDLRTRYGALGNHAVPMVAINERYAPADAALNEGDVLAFIPPVAGG